MRPVIPPHTIYRTPSCRLAYRYTYRVLGLLLGLFLLGLLAESGGRAVRRWTANLLEQVAYGGALGLGILAYGVAGLAALRGLDLVRFTPLGVVAIFLVLGGSQRWYWLNWKEAVRCPREMVEGALAGLAVLLALVSLTLCLLPPDGNEWDALAYPRIARFKV
ncbi:MAG: hypothetical protein KatS3mg019_2004 [Fimbriimonadales bacterium]|nr:MAG: hypothetical protein KatS3mg019_2004 [Fimbriimonadales bacterium]